MVLNRSLVLQKVTRAGSGSYSCAASNTEGDGVSDPVSLQVQCKDGGGGGRIHVREQGEGRRVSKGDSWERGGDVYPRGCLLTSLL